MDVLRWKKALVSIWRTEKRVNLSERMKVTVCLNPVHSATGPLGVALGYELFAQMLNTDEDMMKMARMVAYDERTPCRTGSGNSFPAGICR